MATDQPRSRWQNWCCLYLNVRSWPHDGAHRSTQYTRIYHIYSLYKVSNTDTRWNLFHVFLNFIVHNEGIKQTHQNWPNNKAGWIWKEGELCITMVDMDHQSLKRVHSSCTITTVGQVGFPHIEHGISVDWLATCVILATPGARLHFYLGLWLIILLAAVLASTPIFWS